MAETTTITIRIPTELRDDLDRLGSITKRSRSFLAAEALEIYARYELEIVEGILEGLADVEAGRVHTSEEVMAEIDAVLEARRTQMPKAKKTARG
jgi:predicted transcriptional regulator